MAKEAVASKSIGSRASSERSVQVAAANKQHLDCNPGCGLLAPTYNPLIGFQRDCAGYTGLYQQSRTVACDETDCLQQ